MELAKIQVKLGGSNDMIITPADRGYGFGVVTAPEIAVLRRVHGEDAVIVLETAGKTDVAVAAEKVRLFNTYGGVVNEILPGAIPQMPTLADLAAMADALATEPQANF